MTLSNTNKKTLTKTSLTAKQKEQNRNRIKKYYQKKNALFFTEQVKNIKNKF